MKARFSSPVVRRPSLPLTQSDEDQLATIRRADTWPDLAMRLGISENVSEATLLHAIFACGLHSLSEETAAAGYEQMAASYSQADLDEARASARRRRPAWANDA